jgi:hypothetical protein
LTRRGASQRARVGEPGEPIEDPGDKAGRVRFIRGLLAKRIWTERNSREWQLRLAADWSLDPSTIRDCSAEAQRQLVELLDRDTIAPLLVHHLESGLDRADAHGETWQVAKVVEVYAKLFGLDQIRDGVVVPRELPRELGGIMVDAMADANCPRELGERIASSYFRRLHELFSRVEQLPR